MCNKKTLEEKIDNVMKRFHITVAQDADLFTNEMQFAFDHSYSPIIKADTPDILNMDYRWGLVPSDWRKRKEEIWNSTYNARIEELHTKYSYKNITHQRCLIPVTRYFEYHWNDPAGKSKTLYEIWHPDDEIFSLAGLYSTFMDSDRNIYNSYTIVTTEANERMREVHNKNASKDYHRMPVMLNPDDERSWLDTSIAYMDFAYPNYKPILIANRA